MVKHETSARLDVRTSESTFEETLREVERRHRDGFEFPDLDEFGEKS